MENDLAAIEPGPPVCLGGKLFGAEYWKYMLLLLNQATNLKGSPPCW